MEADDAQLAGVIRYLLAWLAAGALAVGVAVVVLDGEEQVTLPPIEEIALPQAARKADCVLLERTRGTAELPADGPPSPGAAPGVYDRALPDALIVGAVRRGVVVISHSPRLFDEEIDRLATLQRAVPRGTVLVENPRMPHAVAVTAYRRLLTCSRMRPGTIDAVRLFRGRFIGQGPDREP